MVRQGMKLGRKQERMSWWGIFNPFGKRKQQQQLKNEEGNKRQKSEWDFSGFRLMELPPNVLACIVSILMRHENSSENFCMVNKRSLKIAREEMIWWTRHVCYEGAKISLKDPLYCSVQYMDFDLKTQDPAAVLFDWKVMQKDLLDKWNNSFNVEFLPYMAYQSKSMLPYFYTLCIIESIPVGETFIATPDHIKSRDLIAKEMTTMIWDPKNNSRQFTKSIRILLSILALESGVVEYDAVYEKRNRQNIIRSVDNVLLEFQTILNVPGENDNTYSIYTACNHHDTYFTYKNVATEAKKLLSVKFEIPLAVSVSFVSARVKDVASSICWKRIARFFLENIGKFEFGKFFLEDLLAKSVAISLSFVHELLEEHTDLNKLLRAGQINVKSVTEDSLRKRFKLLHNTYGRIIEDLYKIVETEYSQIERDYFNARIRPILEMVSDFKNKVELVIDSKIYKIALYTLFMPGYYAPNIFGRNITISTDDEAYRRDRIETFERGEVPVRMFCMDTIYAMMDITTEKTIN